MSALAMKADPQVFEQDGLTSRASGAYLGLAVGDALGATVEFMTPREIHHQYGEHRDMIGGGWLNLRPGQVTDDTQMSLALGDAILRADGIEGVSIANAFDAWLKSKPVDVGSTVRRGIVRFRTSGSVQGPVDDYDGGNGAVMRVLPLALAGLGADPKTLEAAAYIQAHITHNCPLADAGMMTVVQMVQRALITPTNAYPDMVALAHRLGRYNKAYDFTKKREENPSGFLPDTLRAVFQAFSRTDSFEAALLDVVNRGGDADTTGAILGFLAGALYGVDAIPPRWLAKLDRNVADACEAQARLLLQLSPLVSGRELKVSQNPI